MKLKIVGIILLSVLFSLPACRKLPDNTPVLGNLQKIKIDQTDYIPLEFGKLISITAHGQYAGWSQLWFEDEEQTIRMVRVNFHTDRIDEDVLIIPRK